MTQRRRPPRVDAPALREAFDRAFSAPAEPVTRDDDVALLAIRVGAEPFALKVLDLAGVFAVRKIVPVPSARADLLGVMGLRGVVLPVYRVGVALGRAEDGGEPRWVALAGADERVALAFTELEAHEVVARGRLRAAPQGGGRSHVREIVQLGEDSRPVVDVPSLVRALTRR